MGMTNVQLKIESSGSKKEYEGDFLIATYTVIPTDILNRLGIKPQRRRVFVGRCSIINK